MFAWISQLFVHPALVWGTFAIASPIIIHLLSKRKFRVVNWAAIEFLLEADRRNRRRIRMENLILLLLRCLAVILLALLVARPLLKASGLAAAALKAGHFERIILLDDSPSMDLTKDGKSAFANATEGLISLLDELNSQRQGDTITIRLTSHPDQPLVGPAQALSAEKVEDIKRLLKARKPSDLSAQLDKALVIVEQSLEDKKDTANKVVYIVTDLRQHDWAVPAGAAEDRTVPGLVKRLSTKASGLFLVDVGEEAKANLTVSEVTPLDKAVVAGVESRFEVKVVNNGDDSADDVDVALYAGEAVPLHNVIKSIPAGQSAGTVFTVRFREAGSVKVRAELPPDNLPADNVRYYAAHVRPGMDVLLVDGDPRPEWGESETFFLDHALAPRGEVASGLIPEVITEAQLDVTPLEKYQTIFLCNVAQISDSLIHVRNGAGTTQPAADKDGPLVEWVKKGGGLVFFLGNDVDPDVYNERLYQNGQGLLPVKLVEKRGSGKNDEWVNLAPENIEHPVIYAFQGENNPFVKAVKIHHWWATALPKEGAKAAGLRILARIADANNPDAEVTPAIVEKTVGLGRVLVVTTTASNRWNDWPRDPSFLPTIQDTCRYMARPMTGDGSAPVGAKLRYDLDAGKYQAEALLTPPGQEPTSVKASAASASAAKLTIEYDETDRAGYYSLGLTQRSGGAREEVLFAANIDPGEGELKRADWTTYLKPKVGDKVEYVKDKASLSKASVGTGLELWRPFLYVLAMVLCVEQVLAWAFGRKR